MRPTNKYLNTSNKINNLNTSAQTKELFSDIINGRTIQARLKINQGWNANVVNQDGTHLLVYALRNGDKDLVKTMLNSNTIDLHNVILENGDSIFTMVKNDPAMGKILENYEANFDENQLVAGVQAKNYYASMMKAGIILNAIDDEIMLQNVDIITLFAALKQAADSILTMFQDQDETSQENNTWENDEIVEENNDLQNPQPSLEHDKIKELLIKLLLEHLENHLNELPNLLAKTDFLLKTLQNLENLSEINMKNNNAPAPIDEEAPAFIYNPSLKP